MAEKKRIRNKDNGFVGVQFTPEVLEKLDAKAAEMQLKRSQVIRLAVIEYTK